jgi:murein L,D-transpeptidase YcbB/YkuD
LGGLALFYVRSFNLIKDVKNLVYVILVLAAACHNFRERSPLETKSSQIHLIDTAVFQQIGLMSRASARNFYALRNNATFWNDDEHLRATADSLITIINQAHRFGLLPQDYHKDEIETLIKDTVSSDRLSRLDVLLTDSYLTLRRHLRSGRLDPRTLQRSDLSAVVDRSSIAALQNTHSSSIAIQFTLLEPQRDSYKNLKEALQAFDLLGREDSIQRKRAEKISLNMERWRWQKQWPDRYVYVNIPAFILRVMENDSLWLQSKVIVGKRATPTPVLESVIKSFVIYPYWHVPYSISTKEILPAVQADRNYLSKNNFEVLNRRGEVVNPDTIQWNFYNAGFFPFTFRQREGSENSMGIIKFNFANNNGVYLHDTNSKRLYQRANRDLSHGCVRVSEAVALAHYLVREDDIYVSPEDLDQYLTFQQRLKIDLRKPISLKLEYFTAEVQNGVTLFYDDIYKKDSIMMASLHKSAQDRFRLNEKPPL